MTLKRTTKTTRKQATHRTLERATRRKRRTTPCQ